MRSARQVATDRRHTLGAAATGRAMRSNQNNPMSVCKRVTMPLTSPGVESATRAMTKRKRRLDSGMAVLKLDSWAHRVKWAREENTKQWVWPVQERRGGPKPLAGRAATFLGCPETLTWWESGTARRKERAVARGDWAPYGEQLSPLGEEHEDAA